MRDRLQNKSKPVYTSKPQTRWPPGKAGALFQKRSCQRLAPARYAATRLSAHSVVRRYLSNTTQIQRQLCLYKHWAEKMRLQVVVIVVTSVWQSLIMSIRCRECPADDKIIRLATTKAAGPAVSVYRQLKVAFSTKRLDLISFSEAKHLYICCDYTTTKSHNVLDLSELRDALFRSPLLG